MLSYTFINSHVGSVFDYFLGDTWQRLLLKHGTGRNETERNENGTLRNRALTEHGKTRPTERK